MGFIIRLLLNALVILGVAHFVPGLIVSSFWAALIFAIILGIVNAVIRPILLLLTLPITILTLGLFALIVNVFTFWFASLLSVGIYVQTFWGALFGAILVGIGSTLTNHLISKD